MRFKRIVVLVVSCILVAVSVFAVYVYVVLHTPDPNRQTVGATIFILPASTSTPGWTLFVDAQNTYSLDIPNEMSYTHDDQKNVLSMQLKKWNYATGTINKGVPVISITYTENPNKFPIEKFYDGKSHDVIGNFVGIVKAGGMDSKLYKPNASMPGLTSLVIPLSSGYIRIDDIGDGYQENGIFDQIIASIKITKK